MDPTLADVVRAVSPPPLSRTVSHAPGHAAEAHACAVVVLSQLSPRRHDDARCRGRYLLPSPPSLVASRTTL